MKQLGVLFILTLVVILSAPFPTHAQIPTSRVLDHFKCYPARALTPPAPLNIPVQLKDQFDKDSERVVVLRPVGFCNPTVKIREDEETPILPDPSSFGHLTCYAFKSDPAPTRAVIPVRTKNQFGDEKFFVTRARYLCVPSQKLAFTGAGN